MKVASIIGQSILLLYKIAIFVVMTLCVFAALESSFGFFPKDFGEVLTMMPQVGIGELFKKYGYCILRDNSLIWDYTNFIVVFGMPVFYLQMVFFGFGYAFQFQWTIKEYRDGSMVDTYDGSLMVGIIMLVVRIVLAFLFLMISPLLMLVLIILNIKKLIQTIID